MRLSANPICLQVLLLLSSVILVYGQVGYTQTSCTSLSSSTTPTCLNAVNGNCYIPLTDCTKCIPINQPYWFGPICDSWSDIQKNSYTINYSSNSTLSSALQTQISSLRYFWYWANYTYFVATNSNPAPYLQSNYSYTDSTQSNLGVVGYDPNSQSVVVAFRGTNNAVNVLEDLTFTTASYNASVCAGCNVYQGFLSSYQSISWPIVSNAVALLKSSYPSAKLVVIGHSLGGTQAVLAALDLKALGYNPYLYTYGQPRVGNSAFVSYLDSQITAANLRAVYHDDPVPDMVPTPLGYVHGSTEVQFFGYEQYLVYPAGYDTFNPPNLLAAGDHLEYNLI